MKILHLIKLKYQHGTKQFQMVKKMKEIKYKKKQLYLQAFFLAKVSISQALAKADAVRLIESLDQRST